MSRFRFTSEKLFKQSSFGALFSLWTYPLEDERLDITKLKKHSKLPSTFFPNLIVGHK